MAHEYHDLIVSAIEINPHHGVGILLQRLFPDSTNLVTLRSFSVYGGEESFGIGHHELRSVNLTVAETEVRLKAILARYRIRRILCVPYYREDFIHGLLAHKLTQAPICTYLMDDQNVFSSHVPDHWVESLLRVSDLCLGISPEMCAAYQHKYDYAFHLLPPLVERSEPLVPCYWPPDASAPLKVAMIGNVWTANRFEQLRTLLRTADLHVDWYGNGSAASWLPGTPEDWEADNIHCLGHLPEDDLIASLASYPCILVPSGSLDQDDDNLSFSRLSLPSRLIFLHARTDTPVLLLGSGDSAAGHFILNLGTGLCSAYQAQDLRRQLARLQDRTEHLKLRQAIRHWAPHLILPNGGQWLWESLARRLPLPATFDAAFQRKADDTAWLRSVPPAQPKPDRPVPAAYERLSDDAMKAFAFLRSTHLPLLGPKGAAQPIADDVEITQFLEMLTGYLLKKLLPSGGDLLVLGSHIPGWVSELPANTAGWRIRDIAEWQQKGFAPEASHLVSLTGNESFPRPVANFDAIISTTWLHQVMTPEALAPLSSYLTRHTKTGGFNLHAVTAVLNPGYFWTYPAHAHLRAHWGLKDWPGMDEILTAPDLFCMNEETYARCWQPNTGKTYQDFGKPLGLFIFWRKPVA
ncbi:hypothetical protein [Opitutus sp. GAS368]|uniref:hypothetical protein n=1 Tax=Opitutus sp. GAS368 TaxID=1882749 RepID=UPI00087D920F|nr:hypothetical protein [Opitutus sp. GAS368]SDS27230.1 hypothetical protein SAMN05444173_2391 [Opitutus sp. GAS368]